MIASNLACLAMPGTNTIKKFDQDNHVFLMSSRPVLAPQEEDDDDDDEGQEDGPDISSPNDVGAGPAEATPGRAAATDLRLEA